MGLKVPDLLMGANISWASQDFRMGVPGLQLSLGTFELLLAARCKCYLCTVVNVELCQGIANALTASCDNYGLLSYE